MTIPWILTLMSVWAGAHLLPRTAPVPCMQEPDNVHAVIVVERDTARLLPSDPGIRFASSSRTTRMADSLVLRPGELSPAARVRLVRMDSVTRELFRSRGIAAAEPQAVIVAAQYDAACRFTRYRDTAAWTRVGDRGYIAGTLAADTSRLPAIVVSDPKSSPYPRQRGLAHNARADDVLASVDAVFAFAEIVAARSHASFARMMARLPAPAHRTELYLPLRTWYTRNTAEAEREPLRSWMRNEILMPRAPLYDDAQTRLRGTFVVTLRTGNDTLQWNTRSFERIVGPWEERDSVRTVADLMRRPWAAGHRIGAMVATRVEDLPRYEVGSDPNGDAAQLSFMLADPPDASDTIRTPRVAGELRLSLWRVHPRARAVLRRFNAPTDEEFLQWQAARDTVPIDAWRTVHIPLTFRFDRRDDVLVDERIGDVSVKIVRLDTIGIRRQPR